MALMVARKRCPQCKAPVHHRLYAQFNLLVTMLEHWEYNQYDTPNQLKSMKCIHVMDLASWHVIYYIWELI
jgi:hypothetical protein